VPSSGALYRKDGAPGHDLAGNPYGALELEDEQRFTDLAPQGGLPAAIFRVFNLCDRLNTLSAPSWAT